MSYPINYLIFFERGDTGHFEKLMNKLKNTYPHNDIQFSKTGLLGTCTCAVDSWNACDWLNDFITEVKKIRSELIEPEVVTLQEYNPLSKKLRISTIFRDYKKSSNPAFRTKGEQRLERVHWKDLL